MEMRFCPQCGTGRRGKFCGGCGFHFDSFSATASTQGGQTPEESGQSAEVKNAPLAADLSRPSFPIPFGMAYGESFDSSRDCWNCGVESERGECGLCGFQSS